MTEKVQFYYLHSTRKTALYEDRVSEEASRLEAIILLRNFSRSVKMCVVMGLIYLFFMWA